MCGLAAFFMRQRSSDLAPIVETATHVLEHRGPDHQASYISDSQQHALVHTRLSVLDLSPHANQPLWGDSGDIVIVFNGEIYNHVELRLLLETRGYLFKGHGDTELLPALYREFGSDMLHHLRGMFAFVIYDLRDNHFFCARDPVGKKPLVYAETSAGVALASEIPALESFPGIDWSPDPEGISLYLLRNLRHIPDPWSAYCGIKKLLPGHCMTIRNGQIEKIERYWRPEAGPEESSSVDDLRVLFDQAVSLRREADVEVAALLSGGVDSSAIVKTMALQSGGSISSYTIGLAEGDPEVRLAEATAAQTGTRHRTISADISRYHDHFEDLMKQLGEPIVLLPLIHALELFTAIRNDGIKVVMTGHGGDELFYGYEGFARLAQLSDILCRVSFVPRQLFRALSGLFSFGSKLREACLVAGARPGLRKAALYRDEASYRWPELLASSSIRHRAEAALDQWFAIWFPEGSPVPRHYIDEAAMVGLSHENTHSITIAADLPSMAVGVEVRCPFLDVRLMEHAWKIPYSAKVARHGGRVELKSILREAVAQRIGNEVLQAPKRGLGFFMDEASLLKGPWRERLDEVFTDPSDINGILNVSALKDLKRTFDNDGPVPAQLIAKLYGLQQWWRIQGCRMGKA